MQYTFPTLKKCCFLGKENRYLTEVALDDQQHRTALCTSLLNMPQVDILGTKLLISEREKNYKIPYMVELAEVDEGHMVVVNLHRALCFLMTTLAKQEILDVHELSIHKAGQLSAMICANDLKFELITKKFQPHLLVVHPILNISGNNEAYFPQEKASWVFDHLIDAISYRRGGQRATIIFYILNTGIQVIKPSLDPRDDYSKILIEAIKSGVELITAKLEIQDNKILKLSFDNLFSYGS